MRKAEALTYAESLRSTLEPLCGARVTLREIAEHLNAQGSCSREGALGGRLGLLVGEVCEPITKATSPTPKGDVDPLQVVPEDLQFIPGDRADPPLRTELLLQPLKKAGVFVPLGFAKPPALHVLQEARRGFSERRTGRDNGCPGLSRRRGHLRDDRPKKRVVVGDELRRGLGQLMDEVSHLLAEGSRRELLSVDALNRV